MTQPSRELVDLIERETAGKPHSQRESLGLTLASLASGEEVQFVRCERNTMTGWVREAFPEIATLPLNEAEKKEQQRLTALALRGQLDEKGQARLKAMLGVEAPVKRKNGPVAMTEADREAVRRMGHNPDLVARMDEINSPADFARIREEIGG